MKKETWLVVGVALVAGILIGVLLSNRAGRDERPASGSGTAPPAPAVNYQQNIETLKQIVAKEPDNRNAWVQLGHNYFDSDQPMKAVEAYNKALALDGDDPDILTDQGVMFRKLGWYDRAIENFTRANELDPGHRQSLYNLGVVYRYDLKDFEGAREVWQRYLKINPTGPGAEQIRRELNFIENHPQPPAGDMPQPGQ